MKRLLVIVTPLLILALISIGCQKKVTRTPTPPPTPIATIAPTAMATPKPTPTPTAIVTATPTRQSTPAAAAKPEGELKAAIGDMGGETLDPLISRVSAKTHLSLMYDHLVGMTDGGELSTQLGIANKWEHSADYMTWTFYLRDGVKFHNGDDLTAEDVKFTLERLALPTATAPWAKGMSSTFKQIVVDGPYKVTVNLKKPVFFLDYQLSPSIGNEGMIVPKKYIEEKGMDYFRTHPVGSGPYRFAEQRMGSFMKFEAVDNHFALGVPRYKTITLYLAPEEITRIAMLKMGQADAIDVGRTAAASLKKEGYNIFTTRLDETIYLAYCVHVGESNPLSNKKVREALSLAINKQSILDNIFLGQGRLKGTHWEAPFVLGAVDLPPKSYDPERAKQLLKEAGYPAAFANPTVVIYSYTRAGYPESASMYEAIAADWMKVGVSVKIFPTDNPTWRAGHLARTNVNAVFWNPGVQQKLGAIDTQSSHGLTGFYAYYTNPRDLAYDALIDEQAAAKNSEELVAISSKIIKYQYDNDLQPALFALSRSYAANQKIREWDLGSSYYDNLNLRYLARQ